MKFGAKILRRQKGDRELPVWEVAKSVRAILLQLPSSQDSSVMHTAEGVSSVELLTQGALLLSEVTAIVEVDELLYCIDLLGSGVRCLRSNASQANPWLIKVNGSNSHL